MGRAHSTQGLIIHGEQLCLCPKSRGSHGRVKQSGEITAAWHGQLRLWISLSRQELMELEAVITWEGDSRFQECERMR